MEVSTKDLSQKGRKKEMGFSLLLMVLNMKDHFIKEKWKAKDLEHTKTAVNM